MPLEELLKTIYDARLTGSVRLDFRNGKPQAYSFDLPRRGKISS